MLHILTLSFNGLDKLTKLKNSLLPALNGDYTWLIRDNGSTDNTVATVAEWENNIKVIAYPHNRDNFSAGMNYLFNLASPADNDLVMLLNNDILINDTTSIANMISIINKDINVGAVGCRLLYTGTNKLQHAGVVFDNTYKTPMHFRAGQVSDEQAEKNREFQAVTGAVMITRGEYYRKANPTGMDQQYRWAFDDVDLCLSIKYNLGKKIIYCGQTNISHEESATLKKNPVNKMFLSHNLQHFFTKWKLPTMRYTIDRDIYTKDPNYNIYTG
jgi:GT2 family glycosyltransferase